MVAPVVSAVASTGPTGSDTSHSLNLPSGSGGLLLAIIAMDGRRAGSMTNWTELLDQNDNDTGEPGGAGGCTACIYVREATGSDAATFVPSSNESVSALIYRITGAEALATQPPEVTENAPTAQAETSDPPSLSPTGGSNDYLWFTGVSVDETTITETPPTNYTNDDYVQSDGGDASLAVAYRANTASSEDPDTWAWSGAEQHVGWTLAIHPSISDVTHVVLTTTPTLPAATIENDLTHVVLTTTPSLPAATLSEIDSVVHVVLTTTPSLPQAAVSGASLIAQTLHIGVGWDQGGWGQMPWGGGAYLPTAHVSLAGGDQELTAVVLTTTPTLPVATVDEVEDVAGKAFGLVTTVMTATGTVTTRAG